MNSIINFQNVELRYDKNPVLKDITLQIKEGSIYVSGEKELVLNSENLSSVFNTALKMHKHQERYFIYPAL
jgi:ABC-type cobalamin transport system ATPase subunit